MTEYDTCGATNREGDPCRLPAGWGTDDDTGRCKLHGGATPKGPGHGAYSHGLYSDALRPEDYALLERIENMQTAVKLEDTLNLQIVKLYRAVESLEGDAERRSFWDAFHELVENVNNPDTDDLRVLAQILGENDRAIREWMDIIRKTAKDLHKITDGETLRHEHTVGAGDEELEELKEMADNLF